MHSQIVFEDLTTLLKRVEEFASALAVAIILSQIAKRLLAFENRCRSILFRQWSIRRDICAISASRQTDFHCAGRVAMRLRPEESEPF